MGTETDSDPTLKLSFYTLPNQSPEPAGMLTPPLRPPASVPFLWEEAPGKPRSFSTTGDGDGDGESEGDREGLFSVGCRVRCLDLPPRLQNEASLVTSPTTVLDGPYIARSASCTSQRSVKDSSPEKGPGSGFFHRKEKDKMKDRVLAFWGKKTRKVKGEAGIETNGGRNSTFDQFPCSSALSVAGDGEDNFTRVKITRFRRTGSFVNISSSTTHFWETISGGIKQVVPWRFGKTGTRTGRW
ncbi:hypothetical protein H6P81_014345 [Aristolochia fimbriata]|uniref:Uncharacterized protein n=1 Tax=Aristolochia fimbriata TaxID=158543 RepID=A0AAV7EKK2_ARIFI|nr:hypothetical protein H6P81_014345 [Aristolochia fimbriata]